MPTVLLVFEFLGTTELLVIALVALIVFGPRKLPEIGRSLGKSIGEFKRASDDFKRTWEYEVELENRKPELGSTAAQATYVPAPAELGTAATENNAAAYGASVATGVTAEDFGARAPQYDIGGEPVARGSSHAHDADGSGHVAAGETSSGLAAARRDDEDKEEGELNAS